MLIASSGSLAVAARSAASCSSLVSTLRPSPAGAAVVFGRNISATSTSPVTSAGLTPAAHTARAARTSPIRPYALPRMLMTSLACCLPPALSPSFGASARAFEANSGGVIAKVTRRWNRPSIQIEALALLLVDAEDVASIWRRNSASLIKHSAHQ